MDCRRRRVRPKTSSRSPSWTRHSPRKSPPSVSREPCSQSRVGRSCSQATGRARYLVASRMELLTPIDRIEIAAKLFRENVSRPVAFSVLCNRGRIRFRRRFLLCGFLLWLLSCGFLFFCHRYNEFERSKKGSRQFLSITICPLETASNRLFQPSMSSCKLCLSVSAYSVLKKILNPNNPIRQISFH